MLNYSGGTRKKPEVESKLAESPGKSSSISEAIGNQATIRMLKAAGRFNADRGMELSLPDELRGRMEAHFRINLSGVRLRENSLVSDMGTKAIARGNTISFSPGARELKALLAHNISGFNQDNITYDDKSLMDRYHVINQAASVSMAVGDLTRFFPDLIDKDSESDKKLLADTQKYSDSKVYAGMRRNLMSGSGLYGSSGYADQLRPDRYLSPEELSDKQAFDDVDEYRKANNIRMHKKFNF